MLHKWLLLACGILVLYCVSFFGVRYALRNGTDYDLRSVIYIYEYVYYPMRFIFTGYKYKEAEFIDYKEIYTVDPFTIIAMDGEKDGLWDRGRPNQKLMVRVKSILAIDRYRDSNDRHIFIDDIRYKILEYKYIPK